MKPCSITTVSSGCGDCREVARVSTSKIPIDFPREVVKPPPPDQGERLHWADMPRRVRDEIERRLGGAVVAAITQPTGFSPGVAARLCTSDNRRVFIKGLGPEPNPTAGDVHRREINVMASMPNGLPVPRLLWFHDEGEGGWVVLCFEDVDGHHPTKPWRINELERVVIAIEDLNTQLTPSPIPKGTVGTAGDEFKTTINGWRMLRDETAPKLDEWSLRNIDALATIEVMIAGALAGDTLLHMDIRADNILLTADRVWFVDWPHALIGPGWLDVVAFAPSVTMQGGPLPEEVISRHSACRTANGDDITAAVVAVAGYFTRRAMQPPPPGLPTVRAFQDAQGIIAREWVAQRTGLS